MGRLLDIARRVQQEITLAPDELNELNEISPDRPVTYTDLRTFRQGMYHAAQDGDGYFDFEGKRHDARAVHALTGDRDDAIINVITAQRAR